MANGRQIGRPALYSSQLNAARFLALSPANMDILIYILVDAYTCCSTHIAPRHRTRALLPARAAR
eukprot:6214724-Pleurochrysis_carterae.AAC.2